MPKIVLTGGGTAGHVTPNIALLPYLRKRGYEIHYIGTREGLEYELITAQPDITYHVISAGKLRRYLDIKNLTDPFKVIKGYRQSVNILREIAPDVLFSKGGFVSVPVVKAAGKLKIPAVIHESDISPGLATRLCAPSAEKICVTFKEAGTKFDGKKVVVTGSPIRKELFSGDGEAARRALNLPRRPTLLVMGGSSGSVKVNQALREVLEKLLEAFNVIHLCGKGKAEHSYDGLRGYVQKEYMDKQLPDVFALADMVISRAGSNSINEFLALKKPMLLIPLDAGSRGDQVQNAQAFERDGYALVLPEAQLTGAALERAISKLYAEKDRYIENMKNAPAARGAENVMRVIEDAVLRKNS